jgi:hypothetical protein
MLTKLPNNKRVNEVIAEKLASITRNRNKILEDFAEAYLAHLPECISIDDIELVEQRGNTWSTGETKWYFQVKETVNNGSDI